MVKVVKAVDLAKALGISKATVSLALNDRPGVNAATKAKILKLKEQWERDGVPAQIPVTVPRKNQVIKQVMFSRGFKVVSGDDIDLWSSVNNCYDVLAKERGYQLETLFFNIGSDDVEQLRYACMQADVAAVVVSGAELQREDRYLLEGIAKPMVVYDADLGSDLAQVQLDNANSAYSLAQYLYAEGKRNVWYLARKIDIYNYEERRHGFAAFCADHPDFSGQILRLGNSVQEMLEALKVQLQSKKPPQAILAESFHGTLAALQLKRSHELQDVVLAGIDEIPQYLRMEEPVLMAIMPHDLRAKWVIRLLDVKIALGERDYGLQPKVFVPTLYSRGDKEKPASSL